MTTAIICGGRSYGRVPSDVPRDLREHYEAQARRERERLVDVLDAAVVRLGLDRAGIGDGTGADALAVDWCKARAIPFKVFVADWDGLGRAAGPARNQRNLDETRPDYCISFPGSRGTRDMCKRAEKAGVRVYRVDWTA